MNENETTLPKPFVFVLMPFESAFADIYKFGIKGAADDANAYAERLDEQLFTEGMLDRIFNQISKADIVVADMTGKNPNVFYEVGYAHALGKIVLLLTQNADDIPFDLKHRQHIVYGGRIEELRKELASKIHWALSEANLRQQSVQEEISIEVHGISIPPGLSPLTPPIIKGILNRNNFRLRIQIRNNSVEPVYGFSHIYMYTGIDSVVVPSTTYKAAGELPPEGVASTASMPLRPFTATPKDAPDGLSRQYRLGLRFPSMPHGVIEDGYITFMFIDDATECDGLYRLRIHSSRKYHDYTFRMQMKLNVSENTQT